MTQISWVIACSNAMGAFDSNFFGNQAGSNATAGQSNLGSWCLCGKCLFVKFLDPSW
jgi:hypothetical protein